MTDILYTNRGDGSEASQFRRPTSIAKDEMISILMDYLGVMLIDNRDGTGVLVPARPRLTAGEVAEATDLLKATLHEKT